MARDEMRSSTEFWGAMALAVGAVGVVAVSALYGISPPAIALPSPDPALPQALAGAIDGAPLLRAASIVGVPADILLSIGALLALQVRVSPLERLGWAALAVSGILFTMVDAIVGQVLPQLAATPGGETAFLAIKRLFDILFIAGAFAFGVGFLGVFRTAFAEGSRILGTLGLAAGGVAVVGALAHLAGLGAGQPIGLALLGGAPVIAIFAARLVIGARVRITIPAPSVTARARGSA